VVTEQSCQTATEVSNRTRTNIDTAKGQLSDGNKVRASLVIEENRRIAPNARNFIDAARNLKPVGQWTAEMAAAVSRPRSRGRRWSHRHRREALVLK
jgi:hypothetical protein